MSNNKEFPSLNEMTQPIFDEFTKIYQQDVIKNGQKEVAAICAQYNSQEKSMAQEKSQPQIAH